MIKYKEMVIYSGNLMINVNGKCELYKENVSLLYEQNTDTFSYYSDTLNCYIDLLRDDLSEEQKEECRKTIRKNSYPYVNSDIENQIYVDESSIQVVIDSSNKHR